MAHSYNKLDAVHYYLSDLQQAKECHGRVLSIRLKNLGTKDIDVVAVQNNSVMVQRERESGWTFTHANEVNRRDIVYIGLPLKHLSPSQLFCKLPRQVLKVKLIQIF